MEEMTRLTIRIRDASLAQRIKAYLRRQSGYGKSANVAAVELLAAGLNGENEQLDRIEQKIDALAKGGFVVSNNQEPGTDEIETDIDDQFAQWV